MEPACECSPPRQDILIGSVPIRLGDVCVRNGQGLGFGAPESAGSGSRSRARQAAASASLVSPALDAHSIPGAAAQVDIESIARGEMPRPPEATVWFRQKRRPGGTQHRSTRGLPLVRCSRLSAKRLSSQSGKSSCTDGCCEFHFRPVAVAARLLVVDAEVLRRVSRALLVGQQETSGSAVMGFAAASILGH
ncbi:hypothetical protein MAA_11533 [Metarhizium robertsii ARSEF 23]|uniref:Uncharacterized protein n=1 Tax=Metarhizium robertsii (strain ARSEF 23 / ATCC MYA-3075) TaxID=655844 RepID=A0A0B2XH12_METRA|nr:uncharacterized protein MAA_11533 [Metarhizium robertsii ARSEF 23]KHO10852.1 hypothetical protein MAA_11533 [Metarhizium robertsii ARSEF 23]